MSAAINQRARLTSVCFKVVVEVQLLKRKKEDKYMFNWIKLFFTVVVLVYCNYASAEEVSLLGGVHLWGTQGVSFSGTQTNETHAKFEYGVHFTAPIFDSPIQLGWFGMSTQVVGPSLGVKVVQNAILSFMIGDRLPDNSCIFGGQVSIPATSASSVTIGFWTLSDSSFGLSLGTRF